MLSAGRGKEWIDNSPHGIKKVIAQKCFKAHQTKEGYEIKSQNYAVIWS